VFCFSNYCYCFVISTDSYLLHSANWLGAFVRTWKAWHDECRFGSFGTNCSFCFRSHCQERYKVLQCWNYLGTARAEVSKIVVFMYSGELNDRSPHLIYFLSRYRNMGTYSYVSPRIMTHTCVMNSNEKRLRYAGHPVSAAPALVLDACTKPSTRIF